MNRESIYTNRGVSGCLKEATVVSLSHFRGIMRKMWASMLCLALAVTVVSTIFLPDKDIYQMGMTHPWTTIAVVAVAAMVWLASTVWFGAAFMSIINEGGTRRNMGRVAAAILLAVGLWAVGIALCVGAAAGCQAAVNALHLSATMGMVAYAICAIVVVTVIAVAWMPALYALLGYLIDGQVAMRSVLAAYRAGWRHLGFIFLALLTTGIICGLLTFVIDLPLMVITTAQMQNMLGTLDGDADGMPGYFHLLFVLTTLVCSLLNIMVAYWQLQALCYACGSVATQERERQQQENMIDKDETTENTIY